MASCASRNKKSPTPISACSRIKPRRTMSPCRRSNHSFVFHDKREGPVPSLATVFPSVANGFMRKDGLRITFNTGLTARWPYGALATADDVIFTWHAVFYGKHPVVRTVGFEKTQAHPRRQSPPSHGRRGASRSVRPSTFSPRVISRPHPQASPRRVRDAQQHPVQRVADGRRAVRPQTLETRFRARLRRQSALSLVLLPAARRKCASRSSPQHEHAPRIQPPLTHEVDVSTA